MGRCQAHPADFWRGPAGAARLALSCTAPSRAAGLDPGAVERIRDRPPGEVLLVDPCGEAAARKGTRELGPPVGRHQPRRPGRPLARSDHANRARAVAASALCLLYTSPSPRD